MDTKKHSQTSFVAMTLLVADDNYKSPADWRVCGPKWSGNRPTSATKCLSNYEPSQMKPAATKCLSNYEPLEMKPEVLGINMKAPPRSFQLWVSYCSFNSLLGEYNILLWFQL